MAADGADGEGGQGREHSLFDEVSSGDVASVKAVMLVACDHSHEAFLTHFRIIIS